MITFLLREEGGFFLGEALLIKAGSGGSSGGEGAATEGIFSSNGKYICTRTGNYYITCIGGGGSGGYGSYNVTANSSTREYDYILINGGCAGSGFVKSNVIHMNAGDIITMTIGAGGARRTTTGNGSSGGTTSFGSLLSANGGEGGKISSNTWCNRYPSIVTANGFVNGSGNWAIMNDDEGWVKAGNSNNNASIYVSLNALGYPSFWTYNWAYDVMGNVYDMCEALDYGSGGNGNKTYSHNGNAGCIFVNFIN